jgi:hypothetical protein
MLQKNQREDKLREEDVLRIVYFVVLLIFFVKLSISEFREILFYKNNGWDFSQDSQTDIRVYKGGSAEEKNEYSNESRVVFAKPFDILMFLFFMIMLFFMEYK